MWRLGAMAALALVLSGCGVGTPPAYTELSAEQKSSDHLPDGYPHGEGLDAKSIRYVGSYENVDYFLSKYSEDGVRVGVCILISPADAPADGYRGCVGGPGAITVHVPGQKAAHYSPSGLPEADASEDAIRVSDNLVLLS